MSIAATSRESRALVLLWLVEMSLLMLSVVLAARVRFLHDPDGYRIFLDFAMVRALLVAIFLTVAMAAFGLYQAHMRHNRMDLALRLLLSFAFGGTGLLVLYYLVPTSYIGRGVLALVLGFGLMGVTMLRTILPHLLRTNVFKRRILVLGAGKNADLINSVLRRSADRQTFIVVGFVPLPGQAVMVPGELLVKTDFGLSDLAQWLQVYEIVVAPDERRGGLPMEEMLKCAQRGIAVTDISTFFEREAGLVTLDVIDPSWLVFSGGFDHSLPRRLGKRLFDLVAASALLLVAWPIMLVVALSVWLESGAPILYRQTRVGESGRFFELVKFRSMRIDAEHDGQARWASADDERNTRIGRFIRRARLDELPQLLNVLRGEMSFVGPRPERPPFVAMLSNELRYYSIRHCMKPGLTGWAQLRYPYGASVRDAEEKLKFDLFYVKNHGLILDLLILLQTVEVVLFQRGAR